MTTPRRAATALTAVLLLILTVAAPAQAAGLFAAGPYYCSQNTVAQALYGCGDNLYPTNVSALEAYTRTWAAYGWVDPVGDLSGDPVYVLHGANDTTVKKSVTDDLVRYYQRFGASVRYDSGSAAGHGWVTPYGTLGCTATASPFLDDCGSDPQNALLRTLLGGVNAPNTAALGGTLVRFDQNAFAVNGRANGLSMDANGFAYVPSACAAGQSCRLLVALHGCWDWWGYLGATNFPIKGGAQVETIMNMVRRLDG
ncbi:hypothetical protein [Micromonospora sp. NPDC049102]|uniref:hypothetical protein n=1 Tax=Micromonospora sp. NPDC049102 TaxID=3364265 RepID=UPI00371C7185